jgi:hypothetical protein
VIDLGDKGVHTYQLEFAPHHSKVAMDSGKTYLGGAEKRSWLFNAVAGTVSCAAPSL